MANLGARSRRGRRGLLPGLFFALLVIASGWSALWVFARHEAERNLDAWIASEKRHGRLWACPERRFDGFPFSIGLTCSEPTFTQADSAASTGRLEALRAKAGLGASLTSAAVTIDLTGPLRIGQSAGRPEVTVSWSKAAVRLEGVVPGSFEHADLEAEDIEIVAEGMSPVRMNRSRIDLRPEVRRASSSAELTLDAVALLHPDLNALVGSDDPIDVSGTATVSALPEWGAALPTLLETWRAADGHLDVTRFALTKGSLGVAATGRLRIDQTHRVEGRLDGQFRGLEPIAARFGIPVGAVKLGGLLSGLLGGQKAAEGAAGITLPLIARDGRLFLGPAKTAVTLPPLY